MEQGDNLEEVRRIEEYRTAQREKMARAVQVAQRAAEFKLSPFYKDLENDLAERTGKLSLQWAVEPDPVKQEIIRADARAYARFFALVNEMIVRGVQANRDLEAEQ